MNSGQKILRSCLLHWVCNTRHRLTPLFFLGTLRHFQPGLLVRGDCGCSLRLISSWIMRYSSRGQVVFVPKLQIWLSIGDHVWSSLWFSNKQHYFSMGQSFFQRMPSSLEGGEGWTWYAVPRKWGSLECSVLIDPAMQANPRTCAFLRATSGQPNMIWWYSSWYSLGSE